MVWLNIAGVPIQAWKESFFKMIAQLEGKFGVLDECTRWEKRLDVARVLISIANIKAINRSLVVRVTGLSHSIRLMEDSFGDLFWKTTPVREVKFYASTSIVGPDSVVNSILDLPETIISGEGWLEDERFTGLAFSNFGSVE